MSIALQVDDNVFPHRPDAILDYWLDWAGKNWLEEGETIASSTWTAEAGITVLNDPVPGHASTSTFAWLSGGVIGQMYAVTNRIVTSAGRHDSRVIYLLVE